jgi:hypothetical protein
MKPNLSRLLKRSLSATRNSQTSHVFSLVQHQVSLANPCWTLSCFLVYRRCASILCFIPPADKFTSELPAGQLVKDEAFTLFESVGALEV